MEPKHMCLLCGDNCCVHIQTGRKYLLTKRELQTLQQILDGNGLEVKEIAFNLNLTTATVQVYLSRIYFKLHWNRGSIGRLRLWAYFHSGKLGLTLPTAESFRDH